MMMHGVFCVNSAFCAVSFKCEINMENSTLVHSVATVRRWSRNQHVLPAGTILPTYKWLLIFNLLSLNHSAFLYVIRAVRLAVSIVELLSATCTTLIIQLLSCPSGPHLCSTITRVFIIDRTKPAIKCLQMRSIEFKFLYIQSQRMMPMVHILFCPKWKCFGCTNKLALTTSLVSNLNRYKLICLALI